MITNFIYLAGKLALLMIMLIYIQTDYYEPWGEVTCSHIESLTTFWLVWNYIVLSISFIYFWIFICSTFCDGYSKADYFEEYD